MFGYDHIMPTMKNSLTVSNALTFTVDASCNNLQINKLNLTPQNICIENSNFCTRFESSPLSLL